MNPIDPAGDPANAAGPAERILRLCGNLLALTAETSRTRLELFAAELALERQRLMQLFALGAICGVTALLGLMFGSFWVIAFFWDTHRLAAAAAVALIYIAVALAAALLMRQHLSQAPSAFVHTIDALRRDYDSLRARLRRTGPLDDTTSADPDSARDLP